MKVKEVLEIWTGWDSPDVFEVREVASNGKIVSCYNMIGADEVGVE